MTNVTVFKFEDSTPIRTITKENEPWFVAKDICAILGLSNPTVALGALDADERSKFFLGRQGETNVVNESGLYALVIRSNKPNARKFRKWITSEVLPAIRKTGKYAVPVQPELPLETPEAGLLRMKYNGVPVIPTPDLAKAFGLEHWNLLQFLFRNRKAFTDGVDMFRVKGVTNTLMHTIRTSGSIVKTGCSSVTLWTESGIGKMQMLLDQSYMKHRQLVCSAPSVPEKKPEAVLPIPKRTGDSETVYHFNLREFFDLGHPIAAEALLKKLHHAGFEVTKELAEVQFLHFAQHRFLSLIDSIANDLYSDLTAAKSFLNENNAITGTVCMKNGEWRGGSVGLTKGKAVHV